MKIVKSKSIIFLLVFLFIFTSVSPMLKETRIYTFTDKNKDNEYRLVSGIGGKLLLTFHDDFERIDKVGENDNYFAIFFFSARNENTEYKLISNFRGETTLNFYDDYFERGDKVGENENYFVVFFLSARNEKVETLSIKNYYIIDKNTNEIYKTSEKDIIEKGIILNDVDTFLKKKGMLVYD